MKSVASVPANYVSILELQERWMKEKERNQKEKDLVERGVKLKQQVNGQRRREDIMKVVVVQEAMEPRVNLEGKCLGGGFPKNQRKKKPKCVEKEQLEDGRDPRERKKIWSKKETKNHVEESKVDISREKNNPVKEELSKGDNAAASHLISVETQFQDLRVEEEGRETEGPVRLNSGQGYYRNRKHYWSSTLVPMVWVKKG
ncbi:hypothetical protein EUTSA_v10008812mg [Eutrema salsugineum]|uniref:Uncharacterized protein n=2 Tax=Eutrema salsugineum TaxID=72664 RepID=V4MVP2_EUTSA|nr:hypothetical protein EUTSA_v10008812mg [Eutrema salsugineum]